MAKTGPFRVRIVAARRTRANLRRSILLAALDRSAESAAESARRTLSRRWADVEAVMVDRSPVVGILDEARRFAADVIVIGWRGHGAIRRFLMGSVSSGIVRGAKCAVLVVRRSLRVRRIVVGVDGSAMAKRALALVRHFEPPPDGHIVLMTAVDLTPLPSHGLVRTVARAVRRVNAKRTRSTIRELNRAAAQLIRAGWKTRTVLTKGEPLRDLLGTIASVRPQLLVIGARGASGVRYLASRKRC